MTNLVGQQLEQYQIEALLGAGGMGSVYQAVDLKLARPVALKVVHPHLARQSQFRTRFLREAQTTANFDHPAIVKVYDSGGQHDLLYLAMQYVPGGSLDFYLKRLVWKQTRMHLVEATAVAAQVADALDYAHAQGVVHADVKPANILLNPRRPAAPVTDVAGQVVVTDFGLAALLLEGKSEATNPFVGTLDYLSPEQCGGEKPDGRADIYALGVTLYQLTTGQLPFEIHSLADAVHKHQNEPPRPPRQINPDLSDEVEAVILQALAKQPDERFQTGAAFAQALRAAVAALAPATTPAPEAVPAGQATAEREAAPEPAAALYTPAIPDEAWTGETQYAPPVADTQVSEETRDQDQVKISAIAPRTVLLNKDLITIGRDEGNDIVLPAPSVSKNHATLQRSDEGWMITDVGSTNGVYMGGTLLLKDVPEKWDGESDLRIGTFYLRLKEANPTETAPRYSTTLTAHLTPNKADLAPGQVVDAEVVLLNDGVARDYCQLRVTGLPHHWYTVTQDSAELHPGERGRLTFTLHPPLDGSVEAGEYPYQVEVSSIVPEQEPLSLTGLVSIKHLTTFTADLQPETLVKKGTAHLRIRNAGSTAVTYRVTGENPAAAVQFGWAQVHVEETEAEEEIEARPAGGASRPDASERPSGRLPDTGGLKMPSMRAPTVPAWIMRIPVIGMYAHNFLAPLRRLQAFGNKIRRWTSLGGQAGKWFGKGKKKKASQPSTEGQQPAQSTPAPSQTTTRTVTRRTERREMHHSPHLAQTVTIPYGGQEVVEIQVKPVKRPFVSLKRTQTLPYEIQVKPADRVDETQTLAGALKIKPIIPPWLLGTLAALLLLAGLLGGAYWAYQQVFNEVVFASDDLDNDGLPNRDEIYTHRTDPNLADSDRDGLPDAEELALNTDPRRPDTDADGLLDGREVALGTDPLNADTDGDELPDGIEMNFRTDPLRRDEPTGERIWGTRVPPTPTPTREPTPTAAPTTVVVNRSEATFTSQADLDGIVVQQRGLGVAALAGQADLTVGDDAERRQYKAIVSFDTASLPADAELHTVQLRLYASGREGNPLALGQINVDVAGPAGFGGSTELRGGDFEAPAAVGKATTLSTDGDGVYAGQLSAAAVQQINRAGSTQFRLYFTLPSDSNDAADQLRFYAGNASDEARHPELVIIYAQP